MPKRKGELGIGIRAVEELHRVFPNLTEACIVQNLGFERKSFWIWKNGCTPSRFALQRMCFAGCDVNYILTGRRSSADEENH